MMHIDESVLVNAPAERCFDLARSVEVHLLANLHSGEQAMATGGLTRGLAGPGDEVEWRARHFGVWQSLTSRVTAFDRPRYLQVTMVRGIFRVMRADHFFTTLPDGRTEMRDRFRIAAPLPLFGVLAEWLFLRRYMTALVRERMYVIRRIAESSGEWQQYVGGETV